MALPPPQDTHRTILYQLNSIWWHDAMMALDMLSYWHMDALSHQVSTSTSQAASSEGL